MRKLILRQIILIFAIFSALVFLSSCAHNYVRPEEMSEIKSQMAELQKSVANLNIRLEELNNSVFILQESTKANRESMRTIKARMKAPTVYITEPAERSDANTQAPPKPAISLSPTSSFHTTPAPVVATRSTGHESDDLTPIIEQFEKRQYGLAAYDLAAFLARNPSSSNENKARFLLAECYFQLGDHSQAVREYASVIAKGAGPFAARSTLRSAQCFRLQGRIDKSRQMYNKVIALYPGSEEFRIATAEMSRL